MYNFRSFVFLFNFFIIAKCRTLFANYLEISALDFIVDPSLRARDGKLADAALFASEGEIREADVSRNLISCTCNEHTRVAD